MPGARVFKMEFRIAVARRILNGESVSALSNELKIMPPCGVPRVLSILTPCCSMGAVSHLSMYNNAQSHVTCFRTALSSSAWSMLSNSPLISNSRTQSYLQHLSRVTPTASRADSRRAWASRRPLIFWASPSSAARHARANSSSSGNPVVIARRPSCERSKTRCEERCTYPFQSKVNGLDRSSPATSPTMPCRVTSARSWRSITTSPDSGGARSSGALRRTVLCGRT